MRKDKDELIYGLSKGICNYLLANDLCEGCGCDICIHKYAKMVVEFKEELLDK